MRKYKFRILDKAGKWHYLTMADQIGNEWSVGQEEFRMDTLTEFTGLKDAKGKEIYEGDVCKAEDNPDITPYDIGVIEYKKGVYEFIGKVGRFPLSFYGYERKIEVIGNIHENPELLK